MSSHCEREVGSHNDARDSTKFAHEAQRRVQPLGANKTKWRKQKEDSVVVCHKASLVIIIRTSFAFVEHLLLLLFERKGCSDTDYLADPRRCANTTNPFVLFRRFAYFHDRQTRAFIQNWNISLLLML